MTLGASRGLAVAILSVILTTASSTALPREAVLDKDDACRSGGGCAVSALQTHTFARTDSSLGIAQILRMGDAIHDPRPFLKSLAMRLRTTPDKLPPSMLQVHKDIVNNFTIVGNLMKPDSDPIWPALRAQLKEAIRSMSPDHDEWMSLCAAKEYEKFSYKSCDGPGSGGLGGVPISNGRGADAFFCGAGSDIDWSPDPWKGKPMTDFCDAKIGTADDADGVCGQCKSKELLMNRVTSSTAFFLDACNLNIMAFDCIMDIGDCDIHYCQTCPGRCDS